MANRNLVGHTLRVTLAAGALALLAMIPAQDDSGHALALSPDGRLVVAGSVEFNALDSDWGVLRLENSYVFADGFERGNASDWSASIGQP
jgi:hypothetical protein